MPNKRQPVPSRAKKAGNKRVTGKEQYYTPISLAQELIAEVQKFVPNLAEHQIIEPAGGTGSFIEAAKSIGATKVVAFDIEPKHALVKAGDFLSADLKAKNAVTISCLLYTSDAADE